MILKYLVLVGFLAFIQKSSAEEVLTSGLINDYADKMLELVRPAMIRNGFDPFKVDNSSNEFWFKPLLVNYTGRIDLTNGMLRDLSTLRRSGDVTIKYEKKIMTLYLDLMVDSLRADFDHALKIFNIGPSGHLSAHITKQSISFGILVDFERLTFQLQKFALTKNEAVKIKITGLGLADFLLNIIVDIVTLIVKDSVTKNIGEQIRQTIEELIEKLPPLLPPAPEKLSSEEIVTMLVSYLSQIIPDAKDPRLSYIEQF